jgi:hypothetical protein
VYELIRVGDDVSEDILEFLPQVADDACCQWQERDYGIWELGNFPQAFTDIGLINSALYLAYAEGRDSPVPDPIGSDEHRQHRPGAAR